MNLKSLHKILLACVLVSPITAVFASDAQETINKGHMETQLDGATKAGCSTSSGDSGDSGDSGSA